MIKREHTSLKDRIHIISKDKIKYRIEDALKRYFRVDIKDFESRVRDNIQV